MLRKRGRGGGGGRGNGKRALPRPPPFRARPVGPASSRPTFGASTASANRGGFSGNGEAPEETLWMVPGDVVDFGVIVRLVPGLVDEIRSAEERGGRVRIKFDSNSNDLSRNVIDVDGKEFRFTWSRDFGDLCDIYEERQDREGHGSLAECGSAWRKLNVQRVLDESVKNHVKRRSQAAERLHNSRPTIVLDPRNPSVRNQSTASVQSGMWRNQKEFANKKQNIDPSHASSLSSSKSVSKSRASLRQSVKCRKVPSLPSPLDRRGSDDSSSPYGMRISVKGPESADAHGLVAINNDADNCMKEIINSSIHEVSQPIDLRTMLITLLAENPKGMSLKTLERLVGEAMPSSVKKIESVIRNIATFQAPGRYFLKPEVGIECLKRHPLETGRSPKTASKINPVGEKTERDSTEDLVAQLNLSSRVEADSDMPVEADNQNQLLDPFINYRNSNNDNEGRVCSSSGSGTESESGSESDTTDSGSGNRSQSRSRSPTRSGSVSSDTGCDGSSSSKDTDVEVDITTSDDDNEGIGNKLVVKDTRSSSSPRTGEPHDGAHQQNRVDVCGEVVHKVQNIEIVPISNSVKNMEENAPENAEKIWLEGYKTSRKPSFSSHYEKISEIEHVSAAEKGHVAPTNKRLPIANSGSDHKQPEFAKSAPKLKVRRQCDTTNHCENANKSSPIGSTQPTGHTKGTKSPEELHPVSHHRNPIGQNTIQKDAVQTSPYYKARIETHVSQSPNFPRVELAESEMLIHHDGLPGKVGLDDTRGIQGIRVENHASIAKDGLPNTEASFDVQSGTRAIMEHKRKSINLREPMDHKNEVFMTGNNSKKMKISPKEDVSFLLKFEKDEPEFSGPIKDYSQYKDYVKVYEVKYKVYLALSEHLEKTRNEFLKIACDLPALAKGKNRDAYNDCCTQIRKFHHQHRMIHTRIKKTFLVVYEELENIKQRIKDFAEDYTKD